LEELGMSEHNLVAIGDAENDLALFELAEHSVAVSNADPTLKRVADRITRASYSEGVVEFAAELLREDLANAPVRRRIVLGLRAAQHEVTLTPARGAVLMTGPAASGKAALCNSLLSQYLAQRYQCCVIGAYPVLPDDIASLAAFGDAQSVPRPAAVMTALEQPGQSALVNIAAIEMSERAGFIEALLEDLAGLQARAGRPHAIVFDQAEVLLNAAGLEVLKRLDATMTVFVTSQPSNLPRDLLRDINIVVALGDASGTLSCFRQLESNAQTQSEFVPLEPGQALMWVRESGTSPFKMMLDFRHATLTVIPEARTASAAILRPRISETQNDNVVVP
jgi:hypothetical protein